ncbi:MAG: hypothetical protein WB723_10440, partial [Candidatus Acidiferrales bacterium]
MPLLTPPHKKTCPSKLFRLCLSPPSAPGSLLDPSDVPPGMSPDCADVEFFPGGVRTRPGLVSQFAPLAGTPNVNALKTYITTNLVQRLIVLD